jgi:hypothetical protein
MKKVNSSSAPREHSHWVASVVAMIKAMLAGV